ncbi:MAG: hypothetical protein PHI83_08785 [Sphaerochaetaceae bacterium]|nr:hypothetical protein [Sphaerochaetaceae bacterium]
MKKALLLVLAAALLCSCSSLVELGDVDHYAITGDFTFAYEQYQRQEKDIRNSQGDLVCSLDLGMLAYASGAYAEAARSLETASRLIDSLYTISISQSLGTYLFNDNVRLYQGEDFESVYANVFSALSYLKLREPEDALVEIRASIEKQSLLKSRYLEEVQRLDQLSLSKGYSFYTNPQSSRFSSSALSYYLGMVIARAQKDYSTFEYCQGAVDKAYSSQVLLYPNKPAFLAQEAFSYAKGQARLNAVAFTGLAPEKIEVKEAMDLPGGWFGIIAYPELQRRPDMIASVVVSLDNGISFRLERLESLTDIALDTFSYKRETYITKTILRTLGRDVAANVFLGLSNDDDLREAGLGGLLYMVGSLFKLGGLVSEQADVRSSHYFPSTAWAGGITLNEGSYTARISFYSAVGTLIDTRVEKLEVKAGNVNLIQALSYL